MPCLRTPVFLIAAWLGWAMLPLPGLETIGTGRDMLWTNLPEPDKAPAARVRRGRRIGSWLAIAFVRQRSLDTLIKSLRVLMSDDPKSRADLLMRHSARRRAWTWIDAGPHGISWRIVFD